MIPPLLGVPETRRYTSAARVKEDTDASHPPFLSQSLGLRRRCIARRLPARRARAGRQAGRVVEQGLLPRRGRGHAEDRGRLPEQGEGRGRPLLHRAGGSAQEDQRRPHRAPRARRGLLLLQRLAGGAEVRLERPAHRLLGRGGRAQAPLQREDARGGARAERQDQEARLLRRPYRGADDAHPLLARLAARGGDGRCAGQDPHEVGRVLGLLEKGAGRAAQEGRRQVRQALWRRNDRIHARQRHALQLRHGAAVVPGRGHRRRR